MPKVSIIIPTYNCARYLPEAIESVLNQTYQDFEVIVVDDGSTDITREISDRYNGKIRYFHQENKGPGAARNLGIKKARGKYIAFLDADDIWLNNKLEKQSKVLDNFPDAGFVYTDNYFVDEERNQIADYIRKPKLIKGDIALELFCELFIMTPAVMIRKSCIMKTGLFDEKLLVGEDYDLFLRLAKSFKAEVIEEKLWERRVIKGSLSRQNFILDATNDISTLKRFLKNSPEFYRKNKKTVLRRLSECHYSFAYNCFEKGNNVIAFSQSIKSICCKPTLKAFKNILKCAIPLKVIKFLKGYAKSQYYNPDL